MLMGFSKKKANRNTSNKQATSTTRLPCLWTWAPSEVHAWAAAHLGVSKGPNAWNDNKLFVYRVQGWLRLVGWDPLITQGHITIHHTLIEAEMMRLCAALQ